MSYVAHNSPAKEVARELVMKAIRPIGKRGLKIFSLPSTNFKFEQKVLSSYPTAQIDCVEFDRKIYQTCLIKSKDFSNLNIWCKDAFEYLENTKDQYDLIWLDLCGQISHSRAVKCAKVLESGRVKNGGIFAVTFMAKRELDGDLIRKIHNCDLYHFRTHQFSNMLQVGASFSNRRCELIDVYNYKNDNSKAAPMFLGIYKITLI